MDDTSDDRRGAESHAGGLVASLCRAWLDEVAPDGGRGAAVVRASRRELETVVHGTDELAYRLIDLHQLLGEGPALTAMAARQPVIITDLAVTEDRWVGFSSEAVRAGARAYWAIPLQIGVVDLGVLTVHANAPFRLGAPDLASLLTTADQVALALLVPAWPAGDGSPPPILSATRAVVHQACGMVMVQIGGSMLDALVDLRAHAYGSGRTLDAVAEDVVRRRLRFLPGGADPETTDPGPAEGSMT